MGARKKIAWMVIAGLLIISLISGAAWIGDQPVSAEISEQVKGQFVCLDEGNRRITVAYEDMERTYPLAADVWVYRNSQKATLAELKQGDTLDIIFNSKNQAAYIKAADQSTDAEAAPAVPADAGPAPSAQAAPSVEAASPAETKPDSSGGSAPSSDVNAGVSAVPPAAQPSAGSTHVPMEQDLYAWPWKELELELKSKELELKLEHEPKGKEAEAELQIKMKDRSVIRMKGAEAEHVLLMLMQGLPEDKAAWVQALKQRLAAEFKLRDVSSAKWKLDIQWKDDTGAVIIPPAEHPKSELKGKGKEKEHNKGKGHDKDRGKHDDDDDDHDDD
ncbi:hypothetical protein PN4B1_39000 [Paenibacillus naphthalenovorans]|uniref:hypothetical protein n=1 Tax=Paenibacillus naphthalenovorans TaxID=162209 RepID=UPI0010B15A94|nr:hypothetical protein [Paenibacillus naphthalenovorans]GCL73958.1 hypothetical protein PN4B1_39000 [Paenibacillus naphthalenovorans]